MPADTPPRSATRPASATRPDNLKPPSEKKPPASPKMTPNRLSKDIAEQVTMIGMMIGQPDPVAGYILVANAENFGEAWGAVAAVNPRVKAILEKWFAKTVYANAAAASAAIVLPMATHYGLMPRAWYNPAAEAVSHMEAMVNPADGSEGVSFTDLLLMDAQTKAEAAARAAAAGNGGAPVEREVPDHYEAPQA
jgi:hypothetical protein